MFLQINEWQGDGGDIKFVKTDCTPSDTKI